MYITIHLNNAYPSVLGDSLEFSCWIVFLCFPQTRLLELKAVEETLVGNKTEAKHGEQVLKQTRAQAEEKR